MLEPPYTDVIYEVSFLIFLRGFPKNLQSFVKVHTREYCEGSLRDQLVHSGKCLRRYTELSGTGST